MKNIQLYSNEQCSTIDIYSHHRRNILRINNSDQQQKMTAILNNGNPQDHGTFDNHDIMIIYVDQLDLALVDQWLQTNNNQQTSMRSRGCRG